MIRRLAILVAAGLLAAACSSGDEPSSREPALTAPNATRSTTAPSTVDAGPRFATTRQEGSVVMESSELTLTVELAPFSIRAAFADGTVFFEQADGLYLVRDATRVAVAEAFEVTPGLDHVTFDVTFDDGSTGRVEVASSGDRGVSVRLGPDDPSGVTAWGERVALADGELIYGLTERIVDNVVDSEIVPREVGSLDRRGETVTMWVTPTMSGYLPFHQSSAGYGLLVDGYLPGRYDVGAADAEVLEFEFEWDAAEAAGSYDLFAGPAHQDILADYYRVTGHPVPPPDFVFGHWRGRDEHPVGEPASVDGVEINATVAADLAAYDEYGLPPGVYHIDRPWAVGEVGYGRFEFDPERFPNAAEMLELLEGRGWHTMVWASPWALDQRREEAATLDYLAPRSTRAIDLTNPDAVEWLQADLQEFLEGPEGRGVDGFFMDRGDEVGSEEQPDLSSGVDDVYFDGRHGREVHNWYPVAYARVFREVVDEVRPDEGFLVARPGYTGSQGSVMRWGGDTHGREGFAIPETPPRDAPSTDLGLRSVLISLQRAAFMGTPYWGSDIGGYNGWLDPEVYARWIQVGFASPLMRFHGQGGTPWETATGGLDSDLLDIYRRFVRLRHQLRDYLVAASEEAATSGLPVARPLVFLWPDEPGALDRWDQWMLGGDLLVAPVWESGARSREVWIPPGEWVDFWDRRSTIEGPKTVEVDVPLDVLPMWVPPGSELLALDVPD